MSFLILPRLKNSLVKERTEFFSHKLNHLLYLSRFALVLHNGQDVQALDTSRAYPEISDQRVGNKLKMLKYRYLAFTIVTANITHLSMQKKQSYLSGKGADGGDVVAEGCTQRPVPVYREDRVHSTQRSY